jgi:hypothetical protein
MNVTKHRSCGLSEQIARDMLRELFERARLREPGLLLRLALTMDFR